MLLNLRRSIVLGGVAIIVVFLYAFAGTGLSQVAFSGRANGSITPHGSTLIGRKLGGDGLPGPSGRQLCLPRSPRRHRTGRLPRIRRPVWPVGTTRSYANGSDGESAASNLGPRSSTLLDNTKELVAYWHRLGVEPTPDLVTTSGSGIHDPDITPAGALAQIPMVAAATGVPETALRQLITSATHGPQLGFLGSSYINVLELNMGLAHLR